MLTDLHHQSSQFPLGFTPGIVLYMGFNKCTMTCILYYSVIQIGVIALKTPKLQSSLPPQKFLGTTNLLLQPQSCLFQNVLVGLIYCLAFSDWLPLLSDMHLRFLYDFHVFIVCFILVLNNIPCRNAVQFIHPFTF